MRKGGCLSLLFGGLNRRRPSEVPLPPYRMKAFLSPAERSFLGVLEQALLPRHRVFAKVRLADIFTPAVSGGAWHSAFARISSKHVDFLVCDSATMTPVFAVELDDSSHYTERAAVSDRFKDELFRSLNIRLSRIPVRKYYSVSELRGMLLRPPPLSAD